MRRASRTALVAAPCAIALLISFACSGGGGGSSSPTAPPGPQTPPPSSSQTIEIHDDFFMPRSITVQPGSTVVWKLVGVEKTHTITDNGGAFDSGLSLTSSGATFQHTFTAADVGKTFEYRCQTHAGCCQMQGSVRVGEQAPPPSPGY